MFCPSGIEARQRGRQWTPRGLHRIQAGQSGFGPCRPGRLRQDRQPRLSSCCVVPRACLLHLDLELEAAATEFQLPDEMRLGANRLLAGSHPRHLTTISTLGGTMETREGNKTGGAKRSTSRSPRLPRQTQPQQQPASKNTPSFAGSGERVRGSGNSTMDSRDPSLISHEMGIRGCGLARGMFVLGVVMARWVRSWESGESGERGAWSLPVVPTYCQPT